MWHIFTYRRKKIKCLKPQRSRLTGEKTEGKILNFLKSEKNSKFSPSHVIIKIKWGWLS